MSTSIKFIVAAPDRVSKLPDFLHDVALADFEFPLKAEEGGFGRCDPHVVAFNDPPESVARLGSQALSDFFGYRSLVLGRKRGLRHEFPLTEG